MDRIRAMPLRHFLFRRVMLICCAILTATPAAVAQTTPTRVTVNAGVSLEDAPEPPLVMTVARSINFGRVTIPNNARDLATCRYVVSPATGASDTRATQEEFNNGNVVSQTIAGCAYLGTPQVGVVDVQCAPNKVVQASVNYSSTSMKGMTFREFAGVVFKETRDSLDIQAMVLGGSFFNCKQSGRGVLLVGGALTIANSLTLPRNVNLSAGTVLIELNY
jgi:hypothetical protein